MIQPEHPQDLFSILACPTCKVHVNREGDYLHCPTCTMRYPIIDGVPVMFPDGSVPTISHEAELSIRTGYNPWIERIVIQSLPKSAIILDLGAGNMALNLPNVIRSDVTLTPYVDIVCDAHQMPFLPDSFDFIFSLAVVEHLRNPFIAAQEMYNALKPGGYIYGECNFVFPYHGYPHHYFGATQQGMQQFFGVFNELRCSAAPYQMPSFALRTILAHYHHYILPFQDPKADQVRKTLLAFADSPLSYVDSLLDEETALRVAAAIFFFGVKGSLDDTKVFPQEVVKQWQRSVELQRRFPNPLDIAHEDNLLLWAKQQSAHTERASEGFFRKSEQVDAESVRSFEAEPRVEPRFGAIVNDPITEVPQSDATLHAEIARKNAHIAQLESHIARLENGTVMRLLRTLRR